MVEVYFEFRGAEHEFRHLLGKHWSSIARGLCTTMYTSTLQPKRAAL